MWKKVIGYTLLSFVCVLGAGFAYLYYRKPAMRPAANIKVAMTPERIARGKYIFTLADCDGCHSQHDESRLHRPVVETGRGHGEILHMKGLPGKIVAPNITPDPETGIGNWTDGEKIRAIREGIGRDGRALFPMMPYGNFRYMSDEDVQSLVAYLNSLQPVRNAVPRSQIDFPVSMFIKGAPEPVTEPRQTPNKSNSVVYGEYLATVGGCADCHTPFEKGRPVTSMSLAGGRNFTINEYTVVSANITPDADTGIGNWTLSYFKERFTRHRAIQEQDLPPVTKELFTLMPWRHLSQLPDEDLDALFAYLKSRPGISHKVITHPVEIASK